MDKIKNMYDIQKIIDALSNAVDEERIRYHLTFGDLIDKLKQADDSLELSPVIKGVGAYRGYYSDIALCSEKGNYAYKEAFDYDYNTSNWVEWQRENAVEIDFTGTPKELAIKLEFLIGMHFDGYKGGYNKITREKPLWLAEDYGDYSCIAIIDITDDLKLITKVID